ncbi:MULTISPECIES: hypothetical protein [unclassified Microcoleus]|uniref:hypothetical protein n=1 Tax=unclassified Microcoleus TaxID=2642155 RepID=UPI002FD14CBF
MGTPITSYELQRRLDIAKKREAAREAAKLAAPPTTYTPEQPGTSAYFRSIENDNLFVEMEIPAKAGTGLSSNTGITALNGFTLAEVTALPNSSTVKFKGNHKQVPRIRFTRLKATPTTKMTPWGTRVVDHVDDSVTVPFSGPADSSLKTLKASFNTFITGTTGAAAIGTRTGNYAQLIYNDKVIATKVV